MNALCKGDFKNADKWFKVVRGCFEQLGDSLKLTCVAHQQAVSCREQGQYEQAFTLLRKSFIFFRDIKKWECAANAIFDANLCLTQQDQFRQSQDFLMDARPFVPHFPQADQAKYFYNLALSQLKQQHDRDAALGFGLAGALLKSYIYANNLFEHCPRDLVCHLANAHINQAECLSKLVNSRMDQEAFDSVQVVMKDAQAAFEQEHSDIYVPLREQQQIQRTQRHMRHLKLQHAKRMRALAARTSRSTSTSSSATSRTTLGTTHGTQSTHQEITRTLMPPPPPRAPRKAGSNASRLKAKANKGHDRNSADVKRASYGIPKRMSSGPGSTPARSYSGLKVKVKVDGSTTHDRKYSAVPSSPQPSTQSRGGLVLRAFIEALYKKALELHLKAAAALDTASRDPVHLTARNSSLKLAAYAIQQLVHIYHGTGQLEKSVALLKQCQKLECLTSDPSFQPHFIKWQNYLTARLPSTKE